MPDAPRLLMVDNNPGDFDLTRIAITEIGIAVEVETAVDGLAGKSILERVRDGQSPPVFAVLLDLNMPRMDGRKLLEWARSQPGLEGLPIIIFTSSHAAQERIDCLRMGATEYWVKPANFDEYIATIAGLDRYLERASSSGSVA